jgi:malate dehydrogenase (oxaloacetate-decarboxylating)
LASRQKRNLKDKFKTKKHYSHVGISPENVSKRALLLHKKLVGKISVSNKIIVNSSNLPLIYTPGVASISKEIFIHPQEAYHLTSKPNNVAIVTDGTRVLGLGKIGPLAAIPVMEGKAVLYKEFGGVDAFPLCLDTVKKSEIISTVKAIEPMFAAINLEDIESPKVFDITSILEKTMKIPIFHDDRHGTSVIVLASLVNALKLVKKRLSSVKVVIAGAGSAGYGIFQLLYAAGCHDMMVVDSKGVIYKGRRQNMNKYKKEIAARSNKTREKGLLADAIKNSDILIGVTGKKNIITAEMINTMNDNPIVFSLTNPEPEINPKVAKQAGAKIIATGSYLYPNVINNSLVFPYLMRAVLDLRVEKITLRLLTDTAHAISSCISNEDLGLDNIVPKLGNKKLQKNISQALERYGTLKSHS